MIVTERRNNVLYIQERVVQSNQAEQKEKKKKNKIKNLRRSLFSFVSYEIHGKKCVNTELSHSSLFWALPISRRSREGVNFTLPECSLLQSEDVNLVEQSWLMVVCIIYRSSFIGHFKSMILHRFKWEVTWASGK